jgi:hypothetical protein
MLLYALARKRAAVAAGDAWLLSLLPLVTLTLTPCERHKHVWLGTNIAGGVEPRHKVCDPAGRQLQQRLCLCWLTGPANCTSPEGGLVARVGLCNMLCVGVLSGICVLVAAAG